MRLPSGGTISYTYPSNGTNGIVCADGSTIGVTRQTPDGTTQYARTNVSGTEWSTLVTDATAAQNQTTIYFQTSGNNYYETKRQVYAGAAGGTLLRTIDTCYNGTTPDCTVAALAIPITQQNVYTTLDNGQLAKVFNSYDGTFGRPLETDEYDYGAATPTRKTLTSYAANEPPDRVASVQITDGNGNQQALTNYYYDQPNTLSPTSGVPQHVGISGSRGNLTQVSQWLNTTGGYLNTNLTYDDTGNVLSSKDPGGHTTSFDYTDSWSGVGCSATNTLAYATTISNALGQQTKNSYHPCTGLLQSTKDQNDISASRAGTTYSYDSMGRLLSTNYSDGGQTSLNYNAYPMPPHVTTTVLATPNPSIVTDDYFDSLGRISSSQLTSDSEGADIVSITYDALGRVLTVTNPHRSTSSPTDGTACYGTMTNGTCTAGYDALGRLTVMTEQDGNTVGSSFSGNCVTTSDETGRRRQLCSDGLGRLTDVYEPNASTGSLTNGQYHTNYQYDPLNNLKTVTQYGDGSGARTRSFTYDSISQLLDATNPETGLVCYGTMTGSTCNRDGYDADGNLLYKTGARQIRTSYSYDQLHRMVQAAYSDGTPMKSWIYDLSSITNSTGTFASSNSIGRLVEHSNNVNAGSFYAYDAMGRITQQDNCTPSNCTVSSNPITARYDAAGHLTSLTYPSGRIIADTYSAAGHLLNVNFTSFSGTAVNYTYWAASQAGTWQNAGYWPTGSLHLVSLGNGTSEAIDFNPRLQQTTALLGAPSGWNVNTPNRWMSKTFNFADPGTGTDNGNIASIGDTLNSGRQQNFLYDKLNRITNASTTAASGTDAWTQSFTSDPWGNMKQSGSYAFTQSFDGNNRIAANQGYFYDAAGNVTNDSFHNYAYDAESRVTNVDTTGATYTYDATGNRVRKDVGSDATEYIYFGGQAISEYKPVTSDWTDYIFANDKRVTRADSYVDEIFIHGTACSSCGQQYSLFDFAPDSRYTSRIIQSGDALWLWQWQGASTTHGGMLLWFSDGTSTNAAVNDQFGDPLNDSHQIGWYWRKIDLSSFANGSRKITDVQLRTVTTNAGYWDIRFKDIVLTAADGTVIPIYNGESSVSLTATSTAGMSGVASGVTREHNLGIYPTLTSTWYHQDHLGTSRFMTSSAGYPIWQGTFLPFGEEWNPQMTMNHYKFTDLEHDAESNLEHTQFRQLSTTQGRWLSPDPYMGSMDLTNPQSLNRYAYVTNNPLNAVDPLGLDQFCGDQLEGCIDPGSLPLCMTNPIGCFASGTGVYGFCVFVGLCKSDPTSGGSGNSGGGGGAPSSPSAGPAPTPSVNPSGKPPLSGETLGLPNGIHLQPSLLSLLLPAGTQCEFGPCLPGLGFLGPGVAPVSLGSIDPNLAFWIASFTNALGWKTSTFLCHSTSNTPTMAHCDFTCEGGARGATGEPAVSNQAVSMPTLQKACGPITSCPRMIITETRLFYLGPIGLSFGNNVTKVTQCSP